MNPLDIQESQSCKPVATEAGPVRVSFVIEWANTTYNGIPRFWGMLEILGRQWQELSNRAYPDDLAPGAQPFLDRVETVPELIVVSGETIDPLLEQALRARCPETFTLSIHVREGLEYYALKNLGADLATGDLVCFLDSDVHPDPGWLAHLLGVFSRTDIHAAAGQPYVAPADLLARAFALGWTYDFADETGRMFPARKFYANNLVLRAEVLDTIRFPDLHRRTRGAGTLFSRELEKLGYSVWQIRRARVDHPAPSSFRHLSVRALAHGRDIYMKNSEERSLQGLANSQKTAARRFYRGVSRTFRHWRKVGLRAVEIPAVLVILGTYYGLFSIAGILTHLSPEAMGRRFRL